MVQTFSPCLQCQFYQADAYLYVIWTLQMIHAKFAAKDADIAWIHHKIVSVAYNPSIYKIVLAWTVSKDANNVQMQPTAMSVFHLLLLKIMVLFVDALMVCLSMGISVNFVINNVGLVRIWTSVQDVGLDLFCNWGCVRSVVIIARNVRLWISVINVQMII